MLTEQKLLHTLLELELHETLDFASMQRQRTLRARSPQEALAKIRMAKGWTLVRASHPAPDRYILYLARSARATVVLSATE
jgi:hypothetical protein